MKRETSALMLAVVRTGNGGQVTKQGGEKEERRVAMRILSIQGREIIGWLDNFFMNNLSELHT